MVVRCASGMNATTAIVLVTVLVADRNGRPAADSPASSESRSRCSIALGGFRGPITFTIPITITAKFAATAPFRGPPEIGRRRPTREMQRDQRTVFTMSVSSPYANDFVSHFSR